MKSLLAFIFAVLVFVTLFYFKKSESKSPDQAGETLIVGTESNYPPFEYMQDGVLTGFEIELVKEIAERLHKKIEFKDLAFDNLLFAAKSGSVQVLAAALTPTKERSEQIDFSHSYMTEATNPYVIISNAADHITTLAELSGKVVIVNDGQVSEGFLSTHKEIKLQKLPTPTEAFLALKNGRAFAYVVAYETAQTYLSKEPSDKFFVQKLDWSENNSFGISKRHPQLVEDFNRILAEMMNDGSMASLKKKWHLGAQGLGTP